MLENGRVLMGMLLPSPSGCVYLVLHDRLRRSSTSRVSEIDMLLCGDGAYDPPGHGESWLYMQMDTRDDIEVVLLLASLGYHTTTCFELMCGGFLEGSDGQKRVSTAFLLFLDPCRDGLRRIGFATVPEATFSESSDVADAVTR